MPSSSENLIDSCGFLERALRLDHRSHLLHVQHERIQRLLDVRLLPLLGAAVVVGVPVHVVMRNEVGRAVVLLLDVR